MQRSSSMGSRRPRDGWLRLVVLGCAGFLFGLFGALPAASVSAATFTVDSTDDTDVDDVGTFRWAIDQANLNDGLDIIEFDLIGEEDINDEILIILNSALPEITGPLRIEAPTDDPGDLTSTEYFVRIFRDRNQTEEIFVSDSIELRNVELESNTLIFVGDPDVGDTIDLLYDVGDFAREITYDLKDNTGGRPVLEPGRLVKRGQGELALLSESPDWSGGTLLVEGVIRTDTRSLPGDIQLCAFTADADDFDSGAACDDALLVFELPSTVAAEDDDRSEPPSDGIYAGVISGNGNARVVKTGAGTLTLTGDNTYAGDTYIMQGELRGDLAAIPSPNVFICPGVTSIARPAFEDPLKASGTIDCDSVALAQLTLDVDSDATMTAALHGEGEFNKLGDGTLTLGDQSTFGGVVDLREGELLVDDQLGTSGTSATEVEVDVRAGTVLEATGTIHGDVDVRSGGDLRGDGGTIEGDVRIRSGADLRDALTINGELDLEGRLDLTTDDLDATSARVDDGARILLDPDAAGGPGALRISGDLTLRDGAVAPDFEGTDLTALPTGAFLVADVAGTINGALTGGQGQSGVAFTNSIFDLDLTYGATPCAGGGNEVCLEITFAPVLLDDADTRNQRAIASALDEAYTCAQTPGAPGCEITTDVADDFNDLYGNFAVPSEELPAILEQLLGDEFAAIADVRTAAVTRFNRTVARRFDLERLDPEAAAGSTNAGLPSVSAGGVRWLALGGGARNFEAHSGRRSVFGPAAAHHHMPIDRHAGAGGFTAWLDMHGVFGKLEGGNRGNDIDYQLFGPLVGLDYGLTENLVIGASLGYTRNIIETSNERSRSTGDGYQAGLYIGALFEDFYLTAAARYAYTDLETRRRIRFGDLRRTARADFDASDISGFIEAAYRIPIPASARLPETLTVQPFVSAAYAALSQDDFSETGAGSLDLEVDAQDLDSLHTNFGLRIALVGRDDDGRYMIPQLRIAYEREWLDPDRPLDANLPAAGANGGFEIDGAELPRDRAVIGLSSEVGVSDTLNLFLDYDLRAAPDLLEHSLALGLRALF